MKTIKLKSDNIDQVINNTISELKSTGLVIFPTDTVYGLLCDATNQEAVRKLIKFKNRPAGKPISVFCNFKLINQLVKINKQQEKIINEILPGPYTVILPSNHRVDGLLESEKKSLGVRIPKSELVDRLISKFGKPVTATSANLAGRPANYSVNSLLNELSESKKNLIDLIVDAGQLPRNKPSTVVDLTQSEVKVLRQGDFGISKSETFLSNSAEETKNIAKKIYQEKIKEINKPLIFIIEGELGVGKTIFVKGIGENLGINNIVSPTFVIYYEYDHFYHFDLYQIEDKEEFQYLGIEKLLIPGNVLCFEWGEKAGEIFELLKKKGKIVHVKMKYINEKKREISVT